MSASGRAVAIGGALALAGVVSLALAVGCGGDDTTPDCSGPEAGCGTVIGDALAPSDSSIPDVHADTNPSPTPDSNAPDTNHENDANEPDAAGEDAHDASDAHDAADAHDAHDAHG